MRCPFCDAPSVVTRASPNRPRPIFALGFLIEREPANQAMRRWISLQKMAPFGLKRSAPERITGVYLPAYLYSATARSQYQASIAEKYEKLAIENDSNGKTIGKREETEYRDLTGQHVTYLADILVTASRNVTNQELEAIEPFDLGKLRHYSAALVAGWSAEEPSLLPEESVRMARAEAETSISNALHCFMPGDGVKTLRHTTEFLEESSDPTLVPVWIFAIRYHPRKPPVRILVNGQTGKVGGAIPFSWPKLGLIVASGIILLAILTLTLKLLARFFT